MYVRVCVCVCGSARTSKLARGRCARVLCTSTALCCRRSEDAAAAAGPEAAPLSRACLQHILSSLCACTARRCTTGGGARTVGMRPRFPRAPRHTPPQHTSRRRRRRRPGTAVRIKPAVPLGRAVIRTIRTEPSTRALRQSLRHVYIHTYIVYFFRIVTTAISPVRKPTLFRVPFRRRLTKMRPAAELRPSYRVQMHMQMQQQQYQHHAGSEYDEQPVSRTYQYRKVRIRITFEYVFIISSFWFFVDRSIFVIRSVSKTPSVK